MLHWLLAIAVLTSPAWGQSPSPDDEAAARQLEALEAERRQLDAQIHGAGSIRATATATVEEELPRLRKAAQEHPGADSLTALATALAGAGKFADARKESRRAAELDPKHELAAVTARELAAYDGRNGDAVLAGLLAARNELQRREEVAEARKSLPGIAARLAAAPSAEVLLEHVAALVVLEELGPALESARKLLAVEPKHAVAGMIVEELTRPDARDKAAARERVTLRWMRINAGASASR